MLWKRNLSRVPKNRRIATTRKRTLREFGLHTFILRNFAITLGCKSYYEDKGTLRIPTISTIASCQEQMKDG